MADQDFRAKFDAAMTAFLAPILAARDEGVAACHVFLVHPEEPEAGEDFPLSVEEFETYARFTLQQGFFAGVRLVSQDSERVLHLISWEGTPKAHWPAHDGEVVESWTWNGYPPRDVA